MLPFKVRAVGIGVSPDWNERGVHPARLLLLLWTQQIQAGIIALVTLRANPSSLGDRLRLSANSGRCSHVSFPQGHQEKVFFIPRTDGGWILFCSKSHSCGKCWGDLSVPVPAPSWSFLPPPPQARATENVTFWALYKYLPLPFRVEEQEEPAGLCSGSKRCWGLYTAGEQSEDQAVSLAGWKCSFRGR